MYVIKPNCNFFPIEWTKNNSLQITQRKQLPNDKCGHFAFYDTDHSNLKVFFGTIHKQVASYNFYFNRRLLPKSKIPTQFNVDASSVRIGDYFWILGGNHKCGNCTVCEI